MRTSVSNLNGTQQNVLNHLSKNLKKALNPLMIICYGHRSGITFKSSVFSNSGMEKKSVSVFDIVIVISDDEVLPDSSLLEIAKRNCGADTADHLMIFRMQQVLNDLADKKRFFSSILRRGILLYAGKDALKALPHPLPPSCFISKKEKGSLVALIRQAQQYLGRVEESLNVGAADQRLMVLLLHESAVAAARCFISAHYGMEMQGTLKKMLDFTVNIDTALAEIFPCDTIEEKILFQVISLSFIDEGYCPGTAIIGILFKRITKMIVVSQSCSQRKVAALLSAENESPAG